MATLTVEQITATGLSPSYVSAAAGGDEFAWDEDVFLHVKNGDASSHDVTIASQATPPAGCAQEDLVVTVPDGDEAMIGPLPRDAYRDGDGMVQVSYDAVTSVTVAPIKLR